MPKIKYKNFNFRSSTLAIIAHANKIIAEYQADGYDLTLRQLYYQFVARDLIPNNQKQYDKLGSIINDARYAGMIDWSAITDRTRNIRAVSHWDTPEDIISSSASSYRIDKWKDQPTRLEVWVEKDALAGVFERVCREEDIAIFSCRGYTSASEMWSAAQRLRAYERPESFFMSDGKTLQDLGHEPQDTVILHFGDHDPSGIDMTRDIQERLATFGARTNVIRVALNMDQIREHNPPPNPAKSSDSRFQKYYEEYGDESWELDSLDPHVLSKLVTDNVEKYKDTELYAASEDREESERNTLEELSNRYNEVAAYLGDN